MLRAGIFHIHGEKVTRCEIRDFWLLVPFLAGNDVRLVFMGKQTQLINDYQ